MIHGRKFNHLGRNSAERKALLKMLGISLLKNKRIDTTLAKAKELRSFIEPVINLSKVDTMQNRRLVFSKFQNKDVVKELFNNIAEKVSNRCGGYTRIFKKESRFGDNAQMCMIELVDYSLSSDCKRGK